MSVALPLDRRDALVAWARRLGSNLAIASGAAYWVDEAAHVANAALGEALLRYEEELGQLKPFAAKIIARAVNKALKKEKKRREWEVSLEDAGAPEPVHPEYVGEEIARGVVGDVFAFYVADELNTNGEATVLRRELWGTLYALVAELPPRLRKLVELRYWAGLSWKEVAMALRVTERGAQGIDARVRERLANGLIARDRVRVLRRRS
jgi:RNA polymerase sigma factor (sigma-70 family)